MSRTAGLDGYENRTVRRRARFVGEIAVITFNSNINPGIMSELVIVADGVEPPSWEPSASVHDAKWQVSGLTGRTAKASAHGMSHEYNRRHFR